MKTYNQDHEVTIHSFITPIGEPKEGDICENNVNPYKAEFYYPIKHGRFVKIELSKKMILDLSEQIKELESQTVKAEYSNSPF